MGGTGEGKLSVEGTHAEEMIPSKKTPYKALREMKFGFMLLLTLTSKPNSNRGIRYSYLPGPWVNCIIAIVNGYSLDTFVRGNNRQAKRESETRFLRENGFLSGVLWV
jgi:hypothetical protein